MNTFYTSVWKLFWILFTLQSHKFEKVRNLGFLTFSDISSIFFSTLLWKFCKIVHKNFAGFSQQKWFYALDIIIISETAKILITEKKSTFSFALNNMIWFPDWVSMIIFCCFGAWSKPAMLDPSEMRIMFSNNFIKI